MDINGTTYKNITISWGDNGSRGNVSCSVEIWGDEPYVKFNYTQTKNKTGEKKDFDYKIPLVKTPCHFGGYRFWFKCPLYKSGVYCGRQVGVLYKDGDWFGCRHCYNLTYSSRNLSRSTKPFGRIISIPELEKLESQVKRQYYRGKPTKKYLRFLKKNDRAYRSMVGTMMVLGARAKKYIKGG